MNMRERDFTITLNLTEDVREHLAVIEETICDEEFNELLVEILEKGLKRKFAEIMYEEYEEFFPVETKNGIDYFVDGSYDDGTCHYDKNGKILDVHEHLSDADCDRYAVQVMNGEGYYDDDGSFQWYDRRDD